MDNITSISKTKESDKTEEMNQNAVCDTWPTILSGKYFKIIKVDQNRNKK